MSQLFSLCSCVCVSQVARHRASVVSLFLIKGETVRFFFSFLWIRSQKPRCPLWPHSTLPIWLYGKVGPGCEGRKEDRDTERPWAASQGELELTSASCRAQTAAVPLASSGEEWAHRETLGPGLYHWV